MTTETWTVDIQTDEHDGEVRATARLLQLAPGTVVGRGEARCFPADPALCTPGRELAAGRALADLGRRLMDVAAATADKNHHPQGSFLW